MAKDVCGKPLRQPVHVFPDGLLPLLRCFLCLTRMIPLWIDGGVPSDREKEAGEGGRSQSKGSFSRTDILSSHYKEGRQVLLIS